MPAPDQHGFRFSPIASILDPHLLPHRESLGYNCQASLRADIHRIALCLVGRPAFRPLHRHLHPRVHPRPCSHILQHPECIVHFVRSVHVHSSCYNLTHYRQFLTLESPHASVNGTPLPNSPISHHPSQHLWDCIGWPPLLHIQPRQQSPPQLPNVRIRYPSFRPESSQRRIPLDSRVLPPPLFSPLPPLRR
jgi:hypothetical protein